MNKEYFINKFEAIPEDQWCTGDFEDTEGRHCAAGHCGSVYGNVGAEATVLYNLISALSIENPVNIVLVNDGADGRYMQPTPKQRVLAALRDLP